MSFVEASSAIQSMKESSNDTTDWDRASIAKRLREEFMDSDGLDWAMFWTPVEKFDQM